jgi:hypothetical protein
MAKAPDLARQRGSGCAATSRQAEDWVCNTPIWLGFSREELAQAPILVWKNVSLEAKHFSTPSMGG